MTAMRVVKTAIDKVVDVIAMRDCFVAATWAMTMGIFVNLVGAAHRVLNAHLDDVLLSAAAVRMHKVAILQIIDMVPVADSHMTAVGAVLMGA
jgi:hypothetical protein